LFTPFFTTKSAHLRTADGSIIKGEGLGLAICQSIINQHNGELTFESEFGKGATFIVTLPFFKENKKNEIDDSSETDNIDIQKKIKCLKVLIVDDEIDILKILSGMLSQLGITEIETAIDGEKAIALFNSKKINFVIMDIQMPGINGIKTLEEIKKINPEIKGIIMSGKIEVDGLKKENNNNFIFLKKPFLLKDLTEAIEYQYNSLEI